MIYWQCGINWQYGMISGGTQSPPFTYCVKSVSSLTSCPHLQKGLNIDICLGAFVKCKDVIQVKPLELELAFRSPYILAIILTSCQTLISQNASWPDELCPNHSFSSCWSPQLLESHREKAAIPGQAAEAAVSHQPYWPNIWFLSPSFLCASGSVLYTINFLS